MVRRTSGATSYYTRVRPANPAARTRRIERNEPKTYIDVTTPEVREMEKLNRQVDLVGQAVAALVIFLLPLVIVAQIGIWLGWW